MLAPFSNAFDVYLDIKYRIKRACDDAVYGTDVGIRRSACPACMYRLQDEPLLRPAMLVAMDGNESLKRVERRRDDNEGVSHSVEAHDSRQRKAQFYLEREFVNSFANEIQSRRQPVSFNLSLKLRSTDAPQARNAAG